MAQVLCFPSLHTDTGQLTAEGINKSAMLGPRTVGSYDLGFWTMSCGHPENKAVSSICTFKAAMQFRK